MLTKEHLTETQWQQYCTGVLGNPADYPPIEEHLRECPECAARYTETERSSIPQRTKLTTLILEGIHPPEEVLVALSVEDELVLPEDAAHVRQCLRCRTEVASLRSFLVAMQQDAEPLSVPTGSPAPLPALSGRFREIGTRIRQWASDSLLALTPVQRPALSLSFSTDISASSRQPLRFEDMRLTGSFRYDEEGCALHIEHPEWAAGTLVLAELVDAEQQVRWCRFGVFREDYRPSVDFWVENVPVETCRLRLLRMDDARITAEAVDLLAGTYAEECDDTELHAAWRQWAAQVIAVSANADVRAFAQTILHTASPTDA
jgi:hypothetical protein